MVEQLKNILQTAIINNTEFNGQEALHYKTANGEILSLKKRALSEEQIQLLDLFLTPLHKEHTTDSKTEHSWRLLIETGELPSTIEFSTQSSSYRFTHFYINGALQDEVEFTEAMHSLFQREITLLWNTPTDGVIIEYMTNDADTYDADSLVEAIMTDFYVKVSIYQGTIFSDLSDAKNVYDWERMAFSLGRRVLPKLTVIQKEQLIPFLLTNESSEMTKTMLLQTISHVHDDKELLKTIKIFFESNLNTTLAAKKLFMHRNSLQYRIDKFIEKTGIDIKQFQQAAAMYMLIALDETAHK
ncbi:helix-turn-helix domain-containing protein [Anaerobacillus sp. CMMVII]|uniref:PucR family transcriptional regulator n=1 Tax=Anaerobacillus sp. CMMVII TaxID=2755588 RepID=UPI0021B78092|nr:helix-turn-helix domain-containing protein [Anaerobacillus sp. CMMVII]MCT8139475.1 helix-turn-helix domain-containing protein [Anaerobacillus sp. CMMVII]